MMTSHWTCQYPVMWSTVWTGRFSSVTFSPAVFRMCLHMSHRFEVFLLNLHVCAFTGNLFVIICMSRRLSTVRTLEDLRYLLRSCRQLGSRMKKSVVFVDVTGSVCVYSFVGGRRVSW